MGQSNVFQERAEKLTRSEIFEWISITEKDNQIIRKLLSNSTKLLIGPRGSGKSMLMQMAYYQCFEDNTILPIYVNFEKYLHLEPVLYESSNGKAIFAKWVLAKIIVGTVESLNNCGKYEPDNFSERISNHFLVEFEQLKDLVYMFEGGTLSGSRDISSFDNIELSIGGVLDYISFLLRYTERSRAILLLDDAAHAFSSELQKVFFEIFRILKSKDISAKAAVYPGVTSYSAYFNIGHDGLFLQAGYNPEDGEYIDFCCDLLKKRLGEQSFNRLASNRDGLKTICYAANGIPRGLIVMSEFILEGTEAARIKSALYFDAIDVWVDIISKFHMSLKERLPRYTKFIDTGKEFLQIALARIKDINKDKAIDQKAIYFAISTPMPNEIEKVINILEYAGLLTESREISKGIKGVYKRYLVHIGSIIQFNALAEGKTKTLSYITDCLRNIKSKQFARIKSNNIFQEDIKVKCAFDLPPCPKCGNPRIGEEAKFCAYCGSELKSVSIFYEIIQKDISVLPLTERRIISIKEGCNIRTIKDILMDEDGSEIKKVKRIKGYWAQKIRLYAEEFIGG